jgi:hypothetical protein
VVREQCLYRRREGPYVSQLWLMTAREAATLGRLFDRMLYAAERSAEASSPGR